MTKNSQVPAIRFKGFTEVWEHRKLGELVYISTGKLDANAMIENGAYDFYTSGIKKYRIDTPAFEGPAITIAGNGATVGYMHLADSKFNAYQRTYVIEGFQADRQFLYSEIGNRLPRKITEEARTGNIPYIVMDMLTNLNICIPVSKDEQIKIGELFSSLDNLITLHQRKYDKLVNVKKALLGRMFPTDGEDTPKIRFKGFTEAWEQCELGSLYNFSRGKGLSLGTFYDGDKNPSIAYGHLYTQYSEVINSVNLSSNDESGIHSRKGDLLFPGSSTVPYGTAQSNAIMMDNVKLGGDIIIARAIDKMPYAPFISYQINAKKEKLFPITVGTTITHMYGKDIANIEYSFPVIKEQIKVGELFSNLDNLITLHQRKYEKLVNVKKALLQKIFV